MDWEQIQREVTLRTSRSSGAGGQHVNKVDTRVELIFYPDRSEGLTEEEKGWLRHHLGRHLTQDGALIVTSQAERSQHRNRKLAWEKLQQQLERHLHPPRPKRKAKAFRADTRKRLEHKRRLSEKKEFRRKLDF